MAEENEALFKEIEEEVRQDQANQWWQSYKKFIIVGAFSIVASVAGYQGWKSFIISESLRRGEAFESAQTLMKAGQADKAVLALIAISEETNDGYSKLSLFKEASAALKKNNVNKAIAIYRNLSNDEDLAKYYQDLATILGAMQQMEKNIQPRDLVDKAAMLNNQINPWRHSAREILALTSLKEGNLEKAKQFLNELKNDITTPQGIASRGRIILEGIIEK